MYNHPKEIFIFVFSDGQKMFVCAEDDYKEFYKSLENYRDYLGDNVPYHITTYYEDME